MSGPEQYYIKVYGNYVVNWYWQSVILGDKKIFLSQVEFRLFCILASRLNEWVPKDEMQKRCWGDKKLKSRNIDQRIFQIRKKLRRVSPEGVDLIEGSYGNGYRLISASFDGEKKGID